jgi:DNA-binding NarL/FixJ family response regulator
MDIQEELNAFKAIAESKGWNTDGETTQTNYHFYCLTTHSGWEMWQEAKAQKVAVPDGFVLVPMVPSERMVDAVRKCYEGEAYLPYSLYSEFINQAIIERMEAQEQVG